MTETRIHGTTGVGREATMLLEQADDGAHLMLFAPPAGLKLDWRGVDALLEAVTAYRSLMSGNRQR